MDHLEDLVVEPEHLKTLATTQDETADNQASAATAASGLGTSLWVSHGVICWASNGAIADAEAARRAAGEAMNKASTSLAGKLRTASTLYQSTDDEAAKNFAKQMQPES